ncbi:MAG: hypothetical protein HY806_06695 [Nitrospirae bacterium]|nr:hypothetical protein [Nitrospirota bacterium]MBI4838821.1 hypothetical protein [Nitrospirota bacterium]
MKKIVFIIYTIALSLSSLNVAALQPVDIAEFQKALKNARTGEKIAFWAEQFIGAPYDTDRLGTYVRREAIVSDENMDCMYHVFRSAELALSNSPEEAVSKALDLRFHTKGILKEGRVVNYNVRFQYGEDMIASGKWGTDVTAGFGKTSKIKGSRNYTNYEILSKQEALSAVEKFKTGDIVFFIKRPEKRLSGEIVGHIGIIQSGVKSLGSGVKIQKQKDGEQKPMDKKEVYLIHASGAKGRNAKGRVMKVLLGEYLKSMPFIGVKVTRFKELGK